ncbi:hypothetical protein FRB90_000978 [Tulasnella sp. 427]|nr:hypothetical protein FRB90_000978 [Tulasnella sp. 427]
MSELLITAQSSQDVNAISRGYYLHDDIRPISIGVNLSTFCVSPSALAGVHGTFQWEDRYYYPLEDLPQDDRFSQYTPWWVSPGSAGAQIYLGLTTLYWRPGSFWEILGGEPKPPRAFSLPIASFSSLPATSVSSSIQKIELFPAFGDSSNRVFREEYLSHTVFMGFAQTGGLYTVLDLLFRVLFGTTLLNIVMGKKLISPFGAVSSLFESYMEDMATRRYVGIQDPDDPNRALATSDFLRDYVLDLDFSDPNKCNNTVGNEGDDQREGQQASPTGQQLELEDLSPESRKKIRAEQRDEKLPDGQAPRGTSIMNRWLSRGGRGSGRRGSTGETAERVMYLFAFEGPPCTQEVLLGRI